MLMQSVVGRSRLQLYQLLLILFIILGLVSVFALRHNNQRMVELRTAVYEADKNNSGIEPALDKLRSYVYGHMNTNLSSGNNAIKPPIQLKYTYERLLEAQQQAAARTNSQIYTDAQNYCQGKIPAGVSGRGRVPCVQDYVTSHGVTPQAIPTGLYEFDFVSPTWSPDLAGFSVVLSAVAFVAFAYSFLLYLATKQNFRDHI